MQEPVTRRAVDRLLLVEGMMTGTSRMSLGQIKDEDSS